MHVKTHGSQNDRSVGPLICTSSDGLCMAPIILAERRPVRNISGLVNKSPSGESYTTGSICCFFCVCEKMNHCPAKALKQNRSMHSIADTVANSLGKKKEKKRSLKNLKKTSTTQTKKKQKKTDTCTHTRTQKHTHHSLRATPRAAPSCIMHSVPTGALNFASCASALDFAPRPPHAVRGST